MRNIDREEVIERLVNEATPYGTVSDYFFKQGYDGNGFKKWLLSECEKPIKLTRFEKELVQKMANYNICKIELNETYIECYKQEEGEIKHWFNFDISWKIFEGDFEFLEEQEGVSVQWLLDNAEVVDDE